MSTEQEDRKANEIKTNCWKMNRMGFVNFWLYDEEVFTFEDGKLLLRGQNGSGKSITTQSFIPFILDGDRTPSRLDPFGSSDRKMEYYFLGEEGKEESTGYLFLEFAKPGSGQYRTVCIGQRAQKGKPLGFWGFVLMDGRRIGYDFWLYKEVGGVKLPYGKQEMKKLHGNETLFTDVPGKYKELVNHCIFGFERMEQYEQFIRLLVKVRAPKLSKEFKPSKVYDILNESLQTLTDEDLRPMVDAMEKMDDIQNSLEHLQMAFKDMRTIRTEYLRYNQFMLAAKGKSYLEEQSEVQRLQRQLEEEQQQQAAMTTEKSQKEEEREKLEQAASLYQTEIEGLGETDLEQVAERLERNREKSGEVQHQIVTWKKKIEDSRERIRLSDSMVHERKKEQDFARYELGQKKEELEECQEVLRFSGHDAVLNQIAREQLAKEQETRTVQAELKAFRQQIGDGIQALKRYSEAEKQYDQAARELSERRLEKEAADAALLEAHTKEDQTRDSLIEQHYAAAAASQEWKPTREEFRQLEQDISEYPKNLTAFQIRSRWEDIRERLRKPICLEQEQLERAVREKQELLEKLLKEQADLQAKKELEPERRELTIKAREILIQRNISFVPFYQAVEFAPDLSPESCADLEAQLTDTGILDALVIAEKDRKRLEGECGELADAWICAEPQSDKPYEKLTVSEDLSEELREETRRILCCIGEETRAGGVLLQLGTDGHFCSGILSGHSIAAGEAGYVGRLARRRKHQQMLQDLEERIRNLRQELENLNQSCLAQKERLSLLEKEYQMLPNLEPLEMALEAVKACIAQAEWNQERFDAAQRQEQTAQQERQTAYQHMLASSRNLPYERTLAEYEEAGEAVERYQELWEQIREVLRSLEQSRSLMIAEKEKIAREEETVDSFDDQKRREERALENLELAICQDQDYLDRPENREKAERLQQLKELLRKAQEDIQGIREQTAVLKNELERLQKEQEQNKTKLSEHIGRETVLRSCFEEELALGLVIRRETRPLAECAREAQKSLRDSDKGRNAAEMTAALYGVFQKYNSSLTSYGTALEDCFEEEPDTLRKRQRIVSVWNGKKLYFEEFFGTLKTRIEETELLIREKDRELFENILSRTLSDQLTKRIQESREWIRSMSSLMKQMDTSMALTFSLEWKARAAENDQELDTQELEKLLLRDAGLLTNEDTERMAAHFRSKIHTEKQRCEEDGGMVNYMDLVRDALDYRTWFEFQMYYSRSQEGKKPLTNAVFNKFSGGEKAMAMYVPLFAAVNAQYQKAKHKDHPRMIALDEAFAGVDDKNISSMFELVGKLDFDYIMNSQALWGCYETVPALRISELLRPANSQVVTVVHYTWNGRRKVLDEQ